MLPVLDRGEILCLVTRVRPARSHVSDGYIRYENGVLMRLFVSCVVQGRVRFSPPSWTSYSLVARKEPDVYFSSTFHGKYESYISRSPAPCPVHSQQMTFSRSSEASISKLRGFVSGAGTIVNGLDGTSTQTRDRS